MRGIEINSSASVSEAWETLSLRQPLTGHVLAETLDGGQCFRWSRDAAGTWSGVSGSVAARVRERMGDAGVASALEVQCAAGTAADLRSHLADDLDWAGLADALPWRTDAHMRRALEAFPGLRILRQPIGEALLCFLCSATKQIVQIKQMVALLAANHGRELAPGIRALPTWEALAGADELSLRKCLLGFRARYVAAIARELAERPGWLEETAALPYAEAKSRLVSLPGVGEKIADCVLLFGAGKLEAFPVDVWILRAMANRYGLEGWTPAQVAQFGRAHFGPLAGYAQQFLFAWERRHGGG